jgi:hypothetical protein
MPTETVNSHLGPVLLSTGVLVAAFVILATTVYVYLQRATSLTERRASFAACLLFGAATIFAFIYALAPAALAYWPIIAGGLLVMGVLSFITTRFCPSCGRAISLRSGESDFTNCPYCGHSYDNPSSGT